MNILCLFSHSWIYSKDKDIIISKEKFKSHTERKCEVCGRIEKAFFSQGDRDWIYRIWERIK